MDEYEEQKELFDTEFLEKELHIMQKAGLVLFCIAAAITLVAGFILS